MDPRDRNGLGRHDRGPAIGGRGIGPVSDLRLEYALDEQQELRCLLADLAKDLGRAEQRVALLRLYLGVGEPPPI